MYICRSRRGSLNRSIDRSSLLSVLSVFNTDVASGCGCVLLRSVLLRRGAFSECTVKVEIYIYIEVQNYTREDGYTRAQEDPRSGNKPPIYIRVSTSSSVAPAAQKPACLRNPGSNLVMNPVVSSLPGFPTLLQPLTTSISWPRYTRTRCSFDGGQSNDSAGSDSLLCGKYF